MKPGTLLLLCLLLMIGLFMAIQVIIFGDGYSSGSPAAQQVEARSYYPS